MKYEKIAECPAELEQIINLINQLPPDADMDLLYQATDRPGFDQIFESLVGTEIKDYCVQGNAIKRYKELLQAKGLFPVFAKMSKRYLILAEHERIKSIQQNSRFIDFLTVNYEDRQFIGELGLDLETGGIKVVLPEFFDIFQKNNIPFYRIRQCQVCQKIFWAKRIDAPTCSNKNCSNTFHHRKLRIKNLEKDLAHWRDQKDQKKINEFEQKIAERKRKYGFV